MNALVMQKDNDIITTSLAIAEGTKNQHKNVIEMVRKYSDDLSGFGRVAFETRPFDTPGGTQSRELAILNEPQATLLLTYMSNSRVVRQFKRALVHAFFELRSQVQNRAAQWTTTTGQAPQNVVNLLITMANGQVTNTRQLTENSSIVDPTDPATVAAALDTIPTAAIPGAIGQLAARLEAKPVTAMVPEPAPTHSAQPAPSHSLPTPDTIDRFLEEWTADRLPFPAIPARAEQLYRAFTAFCEANGLALSSQALFGRATSARLSPKTNVPYRNGKGQPSKCKVYTPPQWTAPGGQAENAALQAAFDRFEEAITTICDDNGR